jgi:acyl-CoA thioesterase YciA
MDIKREIFCNSDKGELALRIRCMPADTNPSGDIFGGWLLAQMDAAGAVTSNRIAKGRTVTVAIDRIEFHQPVAVGDTICCYTRVEKIGNTSITLDIEVWATRPYSEEYIKVTEGMFTYVAVDDNRKPRPIPAQ